MAGEMDKMAAEVKALLVRAARRISRGESQDHPERFLLVGLALWKRSNLSRLFDHYWITFKRSGNFLIHLLCLFDNKYFYAGFVITETLTRAYGSRYAH